MTTGLEPEGDSRIALEDVFATRQFLDSLPGGIVLHDLTSRVIDANTTATQILGLTRDQLLGRDTYDPAWHALREDGTPFPATDHPVSVALRTRQANLNVIMGVQTPDGSLRWVRIDSHPIEIDGELVGANSLFVDVTAEIHTRQELSLAHDRIRILAKYPADVVVLATHDAAVLWCSDSITDLMGWHPDEVLGRRIEDFIHPDDLSQILSYRRESPEATTATFFVRLRQKSGAYRWISISSRRIYDVVENASRFVSSLRDAQALVETRQRLETSERRFQFLAENASDVVAETDAADNFTWVSASFFDVLGWRPEELIGRPLYDFVYPDDRAIFTYERASAATGMKRELVKARFLTASGAVRWMVARLRSQHGRDGEIVSNIVSLRDVHEEEMAREEFAVVEERYRLLAENGADLILLVGPDGRHRWVSPSSLELFGWRPEEMLGQRMEDFVHPDDVARIKNEDARRDDGILVADVARLRCGDGEYRWVSVRGRNVRSASNELLYRVVAIRDVTERRTAEEKLQRSEALFRLVLENQSDVTIRLNSDRIIDWVTPSVEALLGRRAEDVVAHPLSDFLVPGDHALLGPFIEQVRRGEAVRVRARVLTSSGATKWVEASAAPLTDAAGEHAGSVVNVRDVSSEHAARSELAQSERQFRLAMESAPVGMGVVSLDRRFLVVNSEMCSLVGRSSPWLLQHGIADVIAPEDDEADLRMREEVMSRASDYTRRVKRLRQPDGTVVWVEHSVGLLRDESGEPLTFVSTFVDLTESRAVQEQLRFQATHDALTQLVNRRDLFDRAEALQRRTTRTGENVGVLYIDIDGFKVVNDSHGHAVGDLVLTAAAARLAAIGRQDDVVARVGGDEFVMLLPALHSVEDAVAVGENVVSVFREPFVVGERTILLGASVGVALADRDESVDDTLRRADAALYQAKLRGRDQVARWNDGVS